MATAGQRKPTIYQWASNRVCAPYRMLFPGAAVNRLGGLDVKTFLEFGPAEVHEVAREADMFIIQRMAMSEDLAALIAMFRRNGILVVYEIDDDLMHLNPASRLGPLAPADFALQVENCVKACDGVQCSTPPLAASIQRIHPEVAVLENQMEHVPALPERLEARGSIVIGYAAGTDHGHDWLVIRDAYNRAMADLAAAAVQVETWIVGDRQIFDSVASTRKRFFPMMRREDYLAFLGQVDVSIIPLQDDLFNGSKSDVKYLESAAMGTPVLASRTAYGRTIRDGENGSLFTGEEEFRLKLRQLIAQPEFADRVAHAAHRYVRENRLYDLHAPRWAGVYRNWLDRREELLARGRH